GAEPGDGRRDHADGLELDGLTACREADPTGAPACRRAVRKRRQCPALASLVEHDAIAPLARAGNPREKRRPRGVLLEGRHGQSITKPAAVAEPDCLISRIASR